MKFAILADSTSDLKPESLKEYNIDYVNMNYVVDGKEYPAMLEWTSHSPKEFYDIMRGGKRITTTQVSQNTFIEKMTYYLEQGMDILYLACSSALSGSINLGNNVAKELMEKYPERTIICVDTLISSLGQGYLAILASKLRSEGKSLTEVAQYIEDMKLTVNQVATVEKLDYLKQAGRVKASSAFFGNLFGVKPIIISDAIGQNYAIKKVKGAINARNEIVNMICESVVDPENQTLYISHADSIEVAENWRDAIMEKVPFKDCYINYIAPIVGASVGPGTVDVYFVGKEVTVKGGE